MKVLFIFIQVFLSFQFVFGQFSISTPISLTNDPFFGNRSPQIGLLENGYQVFMWGKSSTNEILICFKKDEIISYPIAIPTDGIEPRLWFGTIGPKMAVAKNDIFIVFESRSPEVAI